MVIMTQEGSTKIVNVMTLGTGFLELGCGHISHIVKMLYSFKNPLLYSLVLIRQTKYMVIMTKERYTKIVNFMTEWVVGWVTLCIILMMCLNIRPIDCCCNKGL